MRVGALCVHQQQQSLFLTLLEHKAAGDQPEAKEGMVESKTTQQEKEERERKRLKCLRKVSETTGERENEKGRRRLDRVADH